MPKRVMKSARVAAIRMFWPSSVRLMPVSFRVGITRPREVVESMRAMKNPRERAGRKDRHAQGGPEKEHLKNELLRGAAVSAW